MRIVSHKSIYLDTSEYKSYKKDKIKLSAVEQANLVFEFINSNYPFSEKLFILPRQTLAVLEESQLVKIKFCKKGTLRKMPFAFYAVTLKIEKLKKLFEERSKAHAAKSLGIF